MQDAPALNVSSQLARFIATTPSAQLPASTVHMAKRCVLDAVGVSLAASGLGEGCSAFVELALEQAGSGPCTILGFRKSGTPESVALANGSLAHAIDYEDAHDAVLLHPNAPSIPAALAIAEAYGPVSGLDLLAAIAIGCDVSVRMARALRTSLADFGWYPPPILAAFGATAAAARLMRLSESQTLDALSLTLAQAVFPGEIKYSPHSLLRAVRDAFAARAAVTSALLARRGVTGFERPLEGKAGFYATFARGEFEPEDIVRDLGSRYEIDSISFKPWPSCRGTHASIEAALMLKRTRGIRAAQVQSIVVRGSRLLRMLDEPTSQKRAPATAIDAKFSLPFTIATALLKGKVGLDEFRPGALLAPETLRLANKVHLEIDTSLPEHTVGSRMTITLLDGTRHEQHVPAPLGHPANPLSEALLIEKFVDCASHAAEKMQAPEARRLAQIILNLDQLEDVSAEMMHFLR